MTGVGVGSGGGQRMTGCDEVPFSFSRAEQVACELSDAITEPKVVVLDCSGGQLCS